MKTKTEQKNIFSYPRVGPYVGVAMDKTIKKGDTRFRVLLYGAYDAFGLIGSEYNGICVLNEDDKNVVADNMFRESSGYFGPSSNQTEQYNRLVKASNKSFREIVNSSERLRYSI
jgi:hypothetical protein